MAPDFRIQGGSDFVQSCRYIIDPIALRQVETRSLLLRLRGTRIRVDRIQDSFENLTWN